MSWLSGDGKSDMTEALMVREMAPLPGVHHEITAAFEATMLIRCTQPGSGRGGPTRAVGPRWPEEVFVEFSRRDAAERLLALLEQLGFAAGLRIRTAGIREQLPIYQIVPRPNDRDAVDPVLRHGWRLGRALLCESPGAYLTPRRRRHRDHLAVAAWRATALAAGYKRRRGYEGFYIGDSDTIAVLVRAGRVLDLSVTAQRRSGCHLLQVPTAGQALVSR